MRRSIPRGVLRLVAQIFSLLILSSIAVLLVLDLRDLNDIRSQLRNADGRITELSRETQAAVDGLSHGLNDLSLSMQNEIVVARRRTGVDVSRMGSRLSGRLDEMAERMELVMRESQSLSSVQERPDAGQDLTKGQVVTAFHEMDTNMHALELEANALFERGQFKEASSKFALVLEKQPANMDLRLKRAASMFHANPSDTFGYSTIERDLKSALETRGENPIALEVLGLLATECREWSKASAYFRRLLAIAPHNVSYLKEAAESSLHAGDLEAANAYVEEAVRLFPQDEEAIALAARVRNGIPTGGPR